MALSFERESAARSELVSEVRKLARPFDPERWERLKHLVYRPRRLRVDVVVDDSTLREGLQMAGLTSPSPDDMCRIACLLSEIGIERIEVITFTKTDQEAIRRMQDEGLGDVLAGWCRANKQDVDLALSLDLQQIGVSHPVSYIHFEKWPERPLEELVRRAVDTVEYARDHGLTVFVHGEDSTRADWKFERKFIDAVADAGAFVYRICDTVGCGSPDLDAPLPYGIPAKVKAIKRETKIPYIEIHAHDDLGRAVENTIATVKAAEGLYDKVYVSTTFLGIGERAGNAETEKIIMICYMHHDMHKWNLAKLRETANFISSSLNYYMPINKAIVGDVVFAHESGIHLHGVKALPLTYETFPPELVGHERKIIIGKRSGRHGIKMKLEQIVGRVVKDDDPRLASLIEMVRRMYVEEGRTTPMKDREFEELVRKAGFKI